MDATTQALLLAARLVQAVAGEQASRPDAPSQHEAV